MATLRAWARRWSGKLSAEEALIGENIEHQLKAQIARLNAERDEAYRLVLEHLQRQRDLILRSKPKRKPAADPEFLERFHDLLQRVRNTDLRTDQVVADADRYRAYLRQKYALR